MTREQLAGDRYRIERTLGAGGMGAVYQVLDESTGQRLALTCVGEIAGDGFGPDPVLGRELGGELLQPLGPARNEGDPVAARCQHPRELDADPGGGAGDEGGGLGGRRGKCHPLEHTATAAQ